MPLSESLLPEKIVLRSLTPADAVPLARLADNKKIWDNLRDYFPFPYRESDARAFIAHVL